MLFPCAYPFGISALLETGNEEDASDIVNILVHGSHSDYASACSLNDCTVDSIPSTIIEPDSAPLGSRVRDGGDIACQGSLNTQQVLAFGGEEAFSLVRQWLLTVPIDSDGRVWDSSGQQYHQKHQGAWEAMSEWLIMARHYAAHTGDHEVFRLTPERFVCYVPKLGAAPIYIGNSNVSNSICVTKPNNLLINHALYTDTPCDRFRIFRSPRTVQAAAKRVIQRINLPEPSAELLLALIPPKGKDQSYPLYICIRSLDEDRVVWNHTYVNMTWNEKEWFNIDFFNDTGRLLPAGVYDIAITAGTLKNYWSSDSLDNRLHPKDFAIDPRLSSKYLPGWVTDPKPHSSGGARIETWGYVHANGTGDDGPAGGICCDKKAGATNLSDRLQKGMNWLLRMAKRHDIPGKYGIQVVRDGLYRGTPETGESITSASSMWDQVRMGYKSAYLNMLFMTALDAWQQLSDAGLVDSTVVPQSIIDAVRTDIVSQFGKEDGSFISWISCSNVSADAKFSLCNRDRSSGPGQQAVDIGFTADHALAVSQGIGGETTRSALRQLINRTRILSAAGMLANNAIPIENLSPKYVSASDGWKYVDKLGYALPVPNQTGGHHVCRNYSCWGNFGNNQQNGGRIWSTTTLTWAALTYREMASDWSQIVRNLRKLLTQLRRPLNTTVQLLPNHRRFLRKLVPQGGIVERLCQNMHHITPTSVTPRDAWGDTACKYFKDITYGLRTGPLGALFAFAQGVLQLAISPQGVVTVYGVDVSTNATRNKNIVNISIPLPRDAQTHWPTGLNGVRLVGMNVKGSPWQKLECRRYGTKLQCISVAE